MIGTGPGGYATFDGPVLVHAVCALLRGCGGTPIHRHRPPTRVGRRRKSWARSHGFDYEAESTEIVERWSRGVMSTVGEVTARNVVLGQIRGEAVYIFDLEDVATVIALHRRVGTNVVMDLRLKGVKGAARKRHLAARRNRPPHGLLDQPRCRASRRPPDGHLRPHRARLRRDHGNEHNWTLVSMPIASTRAQWDEGLRTVRQFNDLLRVLPPVQQAALPQRGPRRNAPGRPLAGHHDLPPGYAEVPPPMQPQQPGSQAQNLQR